VEGFENPRFRRRWLYLVLVSMKELLEAGVHFGHQTKRWHPKMKKYIYGGRNGIYILDLHKTLQRLEEAYNFIRQVAASGGKVLFVGTKRQAQEPIQTAAESCGMHCITYRWLGGMLTNFRTIRKRIEYLKQLEEDESNGRYEAIPKKEALRLRDSREKLARVLGGVKEMDSLPDAVFLVDLRKERIAAEEARRMKIPSIGMVDTNCDPEQVDFAIPSNDDAIRAIKLVSGLMAQAVKDGRRELLAKKEGVEGAVAAREAVAEGVPAFAEATVQPVEWLPEREGLGEFAGVEEAAEAEPALGAGISEGRAAVPPRKPRTIRKRLTPRER
jgi:small subunit ribosomal protein S2